MSVAGVMMKPQTYAPCRKVVFYAEGTLRDRFMAKVHERGLYARDVFHVMMQVYVDTEVEVLKKKWPSLGEGRKPGKIHWFVQRQGLKALLCNDQTESSARITTNRDRVNCSWCVQKMAEL